MEKIELSSHARLKIEILKNHKVLIDEGVIRQVVTDPDKIEKGYKGRLIAQKELDKEHVLRVVYEKRHDCVLIITLYPGRRGRYEKDKI